MFACFVDFRKAYDSVWREGLFFKLINQGCSRTFVTILLNMYCSVKSAFKARFRCVESINNVSTPYSDMRAQNGRLARVI